MIVSTLQLAENNRIWNLAYVSLTYVVFLNKALAHLHVLLSTQVIHREIQP